MRSATAILGCVLVVAGCPSSATDRPTIHPVAASPSFHSSVFHIDDAMERRMHRSWHPGCPVALGQLRVVRVDYWSFAGQVAEGTIIVHEDVAESVRSVFEKLFRARYPIAHLDPIDAYEGDDDKSMAANNSSAFNCREVAGRPGAWSQHAFGRAIDLNPVQNPFVRDGVVSPPQARRYMDRTVDEPGVVHEGDGVVRAFDAIGWTWGGRWKTLRDYQHFSQNGR